MAKFASPTRKEKIIGAIQCVCGGPIPVSPLAEVQLMVFRNQLTSPGKSEQPDRLEQRKQKKRLQSSLWCHPVGAVLLAQVIIAPEPGPVQEVGEEVSGVDRNESPSDLKCAETEVVRECDVESF